MTHVVRDAGAALEVLGQPAEESCPLPGASAVDDDDGPGVVVQPHQRRHGTARAGLRRRREGSSSTSARFSLLVLLWRAYWVVVPGRARTRRRPAARPRRPSWTRQSEPDRQNNTTQQQQQQTTPRSVTWIYLIAAAGPASSYLHHEHGLRADVQQILVLTGGNRAITLLPTIQVHHARLVAYEGQHTRRQVSGSPPFSPAPYLAAPPRPPTS